LTAKQSEEMLRGRSYSGQVVTARQSGDVLKRRSQSGNDLAKTNNAFMIHGGASEKSDAADGVEDPRNDDDATETTSLIEKDGTSETLISGNGLRNLVKRIADALTALLTTIGAPMIYVVRSFQDENGRYSAFVPVMRIRRKTIGSGAVQSTATAVGLANAPQEEQLGVEEPAKRASLDISLKHSYSSDSLRSTTSESEPDRTQSKPDTSHDRSARQKPGVSLEEPARRQSIRIKHNNDEALKKRRQKRSVLSGSAQRSSPPPLTVDTIKSPTSSSPSLKVTRYPHVPQPTRPLVPRRQPSYSNLVPRSPSHRSPSSIPPQKTLIIDLDETLIHSLAKGGRMSSGHMVEVKLNTPVALGPLHARQPPPMIGPQHPILYYVHKRPHCDEFLRKVCKWYKLVIFTASVQEYADPVIDWLELERKFFVGRYYRQHCTFRNGAYVKDLSSIEPDLSKVIILDNSPVSYFFHEGTSSIDLQGHKGRQC